jgi:hypothetical protein
MSARGFQKVRYSAAEVATFAQSWPCNGLDEFVPITFEFEVNDNGTLGDLVDIQPMCISDNEEGDRMLGAMADDAKIGCCGTWVD